MQYLNLIDLIAALAALQAFAFSMLTGAARGKYKIKAPAMTGHEGFERMHRVQMNTVEQLVVFYPALYIAAKYWSPMWVAALGAAYLVGRVLYYFQYTRPEMSRTGGFVIGFFAVAALVLMSVAGAAMAAFK